MATAAGFIIAIGIGAPAYADTTEGTTSDQHMRIVVTVPERATPVSPEEPTTDEGVGGGTLPTPTSTPTSTPTPTTTTTAPDTPTAPDGEPGPTESATAPGQPGTDGVDGPAQSESGTLPSTGADLAGILGGVAALLAAGVVALLWRRRMVVSQRG